MSWTLCTSGSAVTKAGVNANSVITASGSALANWSDEAEAYACDLARSDVVTNFSSLTANGKQIFQELCSSHIAQKIIMYDPDSIGRSTANLMLNILENNITRAVTIIKEDKQKTYLAIT